MVEHLVILLHIWRMGVLTEDLQGREMGIYLFTTMLLEALGLTYSAKQL
jgi:hypothetical protein